jgi:glutamate dehydrogenase (NAD(P)+)
VLGFGNVGSWVARIMHEFGVRIIAVANSTGAIRNDEGLDPHVLREHLDAGGSLNDFEQAESIPSDDFLKTPCDVLVPAALGGMINEQNASEINCSLVLEGANGPTTPAADDVLQDKGVTIVPDVMASAGGVVVSYFEWVQNMQHMRWDEREINDKLGSIMRRAFREVDAAARERHLSLRGAAYEMAINRVVESARLRGYI